MFGVVREFGVAFPVWCFLAGLFARYVGNGPVFLVLNNFNSILRYNQAKSYALAVGHLSDRLKGGSPFVHPWPTDETHLSLDQRIELQNLLVAKGLLIGDADGVIGPATLEAVKTYQRTKGLPVDGFPSRTILEMLKKES
jgi:membrane-bound lytic murein transglycosylase B